jgi:hypothetical protein
VDQMSQSRTASLTLDQPTAPQPHLLVCVLGGFRVLLMGRPVPLSPKEISLLAALAVRGPRGAAVDSLLFEDLADQGDRLARIGDWHHATELYARAGALYVGAQNAWACGSRRRRGRFQGEREISRGPPLGHRVVASPARKCHGGVPVGEADLTLHQCRSAQIRRFFGGVVQRGVSPFGSSAWSSADCRPRVLAAAWGGRRGNRQACAG